jgi:hypothetical protein
LQGSENGRVVTIAWSYGRWTYNYLCNQCLSPLMLWVRIWTRARCTTLWDIVCQWLTIGRWFSPGSPVSSTNKTDRHDTTAEILLKVTLNTITHNTSQLNIAEIITLYYSIDYCTTLSHSLLSYFMLITEFKWENNNSRLHR